MTIPYGRQTIDQADVDSVTEVLQGDWLTQGPAVESFERAIKETTGARYAVAFANGTAALHAAAAAATLGPGDELITSALTFAASANCAAYLGATPRFADIEPSSWNISPDSVAASVTSSTKAIVPVHFAGLPAPVRAIRERVGPDVRIIEDAAHALGAWDGEGPIGACRHSDMTTFSFHPIKAITSGEGGMVTTNDPGLRDRLMAFRDHGFARAAAGAEDGWWYDQRALGFNYRLSDIHSALGRSQLCRLDTFIARRNEVAARYREALADLEALELPPGAPEGSLHAYHLFVIRHRKGAEARRRLYDHLRERGIAVQVHYIPVYWHTWYREKLGYQRGLCPQAEAYYAGALSLPCYPGLSEEDQLTVIRVLRDALKGIPH